MTLQDIVQNLWPQQKVVIFLLLLSILVGVIRYKKLYQPDRLFVWLILFELVIELGSIYVNSIIKVDNYFCYNTYFMTIYPLFLLYYKKLGINFPFYTLLSFFFSRLLYSFFFESFKEGLYSITPLFGAITIVSSIFYYFSHLLKTRQLEHLLKNSSFLFSCGLMIFYTASIPYILLNKYLELTHVNHQIIVIFLNIILYTFYILAFLCSRRKIY